MDLLPVLPIIIPMFTAVATVLAGNRLNLQRGLSMAGTGLLLTASIGLLIAVWQESILVVQIGNWPAPFGITLVADLTSAVMVVMAGLLGFTIAIYALGSLDRERESFGFHPLFHVLLLGVSGAFLTGDLFNLYVWFEVMLIASFVLIALGGSRPQLEGAIKYVTLNLLASTLFLAALGILYGLTGTLNMAYLARQLATGPASGLITAVSMLFLVAFGIKAAVFPLFFWLPASYHTAPVVVSAIFAGLLTKVGVYALLRVFTLIFVHDTGYTHTILLAIAAITMVIGVLGAVAQNELRRLLSFHIISQIGYMIMGLAFLTPLALAGAIFFVIHNILAKTNLFLVSGVVQRLYGTEQLKHLGGLYRSRPGLAGLFLISALSLAGLPPLSGFWAKLILIQAGLEIQQYGIVAVALGVSILTLFSMTKIWAEVFWKESPGEGQPAGKLSRATWTALVAPMVVLTVLIASTVVTAGPFFALTLRAAEQLMSPAGYILAVLGAVP